MRERETGRVRESEREGERENERERERGRVRERERGGLLRRVCPSHCCWCFPAKDRTDVFVGLDISPRIILRSVMTSMEVGKLACVCVCVCVSVCVCGSMWVQGGDGRGGVGVGSLMTESCLHSFVRSLRMKEGMNQLFDKLVQLPLGPLPF